MRFWPAFERYVTLVFAHSRRRTIVATACFGFAVAMAVSLPRGAPPPPHVHDEFSYLLAGDTYAHGRLANPSHPMHEFFETFHVLQEPTYASKFPPAQGLFLALGQALAQWPIVGVWISFAVMCGAFTWMLLGWMNVRWASSAGVFTALYLAGAQANVGLWAASYWGGAIAATGGALLLGAVRRATAAPRVLHGVLIAIGLALMANSRPYEGLIASIPALCVLAAWLVRDDRHTAATRITRIALPAAVILGLLGLWMGYYNFRVTGSPLTMPYSLYVKVDGSASPFLFGHANAVPFQNDVLDRFYRSMQGPRTPAALVKWVAGNIMTYVKFYCPVFLAAALLFFPRVLWLPKYRLATATLAFMGLGLLSDTWSWGHYAAPAAGAYLLLSTDAVRRLRASRYRRTWLARNFIRIGAVAVLLSAMAYPVYTMLRRDRYQAKWFVQRAAMIDRLTATGQQHLIVVDYEPKHNVNEEWVFNGADVDAAPVVFARSLGPARDSVLLSYFRERRVWRLHVIDEGPFELRPSSP